MMTAKNMIDSRPAFVFRVSRLSLILSARQGTMQAFSRRICPETGIQV